MAFWVSRMGVPPSLFPRISLSPVGRWMASRVRYYSAYRVDLDSVEPGDILSGIPIHRMNWDCEGVCEIAFPASDELSTILNTVPSSDTERPAVRRLACQAVQVYDFNKLNDLQPRRYYSDESDTLAPALKTALDSVEVIGEEKRLKTYSSSDTDSQEFSFPNVFPGDKIVVRVGWNEEQAGGFIQKAAKQLQEKAYTSFSLLHLGTSEPSPDAVAPQCKHFTQGCSGCRIQNLNVKRQLMAKRQLIISMLQKSYTLDENEQKVKTEFLRDLFRLQLMGRYSPSNVREINARYEYDLPKYKDRSFLENVRLSSSEAESLVKPVVADERPYGFLENGYFETTQTVDGPKIAFEFANAPFKYLSTSECPLLDRSAYSLVQVILEALRVHATKITTACVNRLTGHVLGFTFRTSRSETKTEHLVHFKLLKPPCSEAFSALADTIRKRCPTCVGVTAELSAMNGVADNVDGAIHTFSAVVSGTDTVAMNRSRKVVHQSGTSTSRLACGSTRVFQSLCDEIVRIIGKRTAPQDGPTVIWDLNAEEGLASSLLACEDSAEQIVTITSSWDGARILGKTLGVEAFNQIVGVGNIEEEVVLENVLRTVDSNAHQQSNGRRNGSERHGSDALTALCHSRNIIPSAASLRRKLYFLQRLPIESDAAPCSPSRDTKCVMVRDVVSYSQLMDEYVHCNEASSRLSFWAKGSANPVAFSGGFDVQLMPPSILVLHHWKQKQFSKMWYKKLCNGLAKLRSRYPLVSKIGHKIVLLSSEPKYLDHDIRQLRRLGYKIDRVSTFDGRAHVTDMRVLVLMRFVTGDKSPPVDSDAGCP